MAAGHDGPEIPEAKRVYFQRRFRGRFFDFIRTKFDSEQTNGLTQAKLARRLGKKPDVINRWLSSPSNLTLDSISDLMIGISAEEVELDGRSLLNRPRSNYHHLDEFNPDDEKLRNATIRSDQINQDNRPPVLGSPRESNPASDSDDSYLKQLVAKKNK